jgi:hypothetical protein
MTGVPACATLGRSSAPSGSIDLVREPLQVAGLRVTADSLRARRSSGASAANALLITEQRNWSPLSDKQGASHCHQSASTACSTQQAVVHLPAGQQ